MKTIDDLTPEIIAKILEYQARAVEGVFDGKRYAAFDINKARAAVKWNYNACEMKEPVVIVTENPLEQQLVFNMLNNNLEKYRPLVDAMAEKLETATDEQKNKDSNDLIGMIFEDLKKCSKKELKALCKEYNNAYLYTLNVYSDVYYTWFKFIKTEFNLPLSIEKKFEECFGLQRASGVYSCIFSEDIVVVSKYPLEVHQDASNEYALHNTTDEAVKFAYTQFPLHCYYVNGRNLEANIFKKVVEGKYTLSQFNKLDNEDVKGSIATIIRTNKGPEGLLAFLGAEVVDTCILQHANGYSETHELLRTKDKYSWASDGEGNSNVQLAWQKMVCPSTGTVYMIETKPTFNSALESAKWLRPSNVPTSVPYLWQSAN